MYMYTYRCSLFFIVLFVCVFSWYTGFHGRCCRRQNFVHFGFFLLLLFHISNNEKKRINNTITYGITIYYNQLTLKAMPYRIYDFFYCIFLCRSRTIYTKSECSSSCVCVSDFDVYFDKSGRENGYAVAFKTDFFRFFTLLSVSI